MWKQAPNKDGSKKNHGFGHNFSKARREKEKRETRKKKREEGIGGGGATWSRIRCLGSGEGGVSRSQSPLRFSQKTEAAENRDHCLSICLTTVTVFVCHVC